MRKILFILFIILSMGILNACTLFGFDSNLKRNIVPKPTMKKLNEQNLDGIFTTETGYKKYRHELKLIREESRNVKEDSFNSPLVKPFEDLIEINETYPTVLQSTSYVDTIKLIFFGVYKRSTISHMVM